MPNSLSSAHKSAASAAPLLALVGEACPLCEQEIPHDRHDEVTARIEMKSRAREAELDQRIEQRVNAERTAFQEQARHETAKQVAKAREETKREVETAAQTRIDEVIKAAAASRLELQSKLADAQAEAEKVRQASLEREGEIRQEAREAAAAGVKDQIDAMVKERADAEAGLRQTIASFEAAKKESEGIIANLSGALEQLRTSAATQLEEVRRQALERESTVRREATAAAQTASAAQLQESEAARAALAEKVTLAETNLAKLTQEHENHLAGRLKEQREALEQDKVEAVNKEKQAAFEEKLKLSGKVEELQRAIDKKTAEELGEAAEVNLFEELRATFSEDEIVRVGKGQQGADVIHTVKHNGQVCGEIIYDSKNHNGWRSDFVTKLASDKLARRADHAILSSRKLPEGARHLALRDGIIVATPGRVLVLAEIVRRHIIEIHGQRMSNDARAEKTEALYAFITSKHCGDLLERIDHQTEALLQLQEKEIKAHQRNWAEQGTLIRTVQKARIELSSQIDSIIGTDGLGSTRESDQ